MKLSKHIVALIMLSILFNLAITSDRCSRETSQFIPPTFRPSRMAVIKERFNPEVVSTENYDPIAFRRRGKYQKDSNKTGNGVESQNGDAFPAASNEVLSGHSTGTTAEPNTEPFLRNMNTEAICNPSTESIHRPSTEIITAYNIEINNQMTMESTSLSFEELILATVKQLKKEEGLLEEPN
ncbi:hypothetical protein FQR65_LT05502 [Abscondita terminalis]|nr:hypothetical protein FQR65_LT05502 [Abscondita terminalis]